MGLLEALFLDMPNGETKFVSRRTRRERSKDKTRSYQATKDWTGKDREGPNLHLLLMNAPLLFFLVHVLESGLLSDSPIGPAQEGHEHLFCSSFLHSRTNPLIFGDRPSCVQGISMFSDIRSPKVGAPKGQGIGVMGSETPSFEYK